MKHENKAALRRENTIYELAESMRAAQRSMRISESRILRGDARPPEPSVQRVAGRVGVWKGGC